MLHSVKYKDPTRGTRHPCIWRGKHTKPRDPLPQSLCIQRLVCLVCSQSWVGCDKVTMVFVHRLRFGFRHLEKQSKQSKKAILPTLMKPVRPVEVHTWQGRSWQKEISNNQKNLPTNNNINERILWKPTTATKKDLAINNNTISTWPARWWNCSPHADQTHYSFSNTGLGLFLMIENLMKKKMMLWSSNLFCPSPSSWTSSACTRLCSGNFSGNLGRCPRDLDFGLDKRRMRKSKE